MISPNMIIMGNFHTKRKAPGREEYSWSTFDSSRDLGLDRASSARTHPCSGRRHWSTPALLAQERRDHGWHICPHISQESEQCAGVWVSVAPKSTFSAKTGRKMGKGDSAIFCLAYCIFDASCWCILGLSRVAPSVLTMLWSQITVRVDLITELSFWKSGTN